MFSQQQIAFVFNNESVPINSKEDIVYYKMSLKNKPINDDWVVLKAKSYKKRHQVNDKTKYEINADFNDIIGLMNCNEDNKLLIDFKVEYINKDNKRESRNGRQILKSEFWGGSCSDIDKSKLVPLPFHEEDYFDIENNIILQESYPPLIQIDLSEPVLIFFGKVESNKREIIDSVLISGDKITEEDLILEPATYDKRTGKYSIKIKIDSDKPLGLYPDPYWIKFLSEDYLSNYVMIDVDMLKYGGEQEEYILMEPRNHKDWSKKKYHSDKSYTVYNDDCMEWQCKDPKQLAVHHYNECVTPCEGKEKGYKNPKTKVWECQANPTSIDERSVLQKAKDISNDIMRKNFVKKNTIECKWNKDFEDYILYMICQEENASKLLEEDLYFLIDASTALYKIIRKTMNDSDLQSLLTANSEKLNSIEALFLLNDMIETLDYKYSHAQGDFKSTFLTSYKYNIPEYLKYTIKSDYYLDQADFYLWILESLTFLLDSQNTSFNKKNTSFKYIDLKRIDGTKSRLFCKHISDNDFKNIDIKSLIRKTKKNLAKNMTNFKKTYPEAKKLEYYEWEAKFSTYNDILFKFTRLKNEI